MRTFSISILSVCMLAVAFTSCGKLGRALGSEDVSMDSEEVAAKVKELVTKHVDASKWKIYEITWYENEELGNDLGGMKLTMINKDNKYYTQTIRQNNTKEYVVDELEEPIMPKSVRAEIMFDQVVGIDFNKLDGKLIAKQLEEAKALIPAEYEFKSVASYTIEEEVKKIGKMDKLSPKKGNDDNKYGKQTVSFELNALKQGEGKEMKGRQIITNYYPISYSVQEDGSVKIDE